MSLRFIMGGSGSGKSCFLYDRIIEESMKNPDKNYFIIAPEQFTLQTQLDVVSRHPRGGIMNIDALSFERLAFRTLSEVGKDQKTILRDTGKSLLLRRAADDVEDQLSVFGHNIHKLGYINELKSTLSEFEQYQIGREELGDMIRISEEQGALSGKLKDMLILQDKFREYMGQDYITAEGLLESLCPYVSKSAALAGSVVALDGFTGFTPIQLSLLGEIFKTADEVLVTAEMDRREEPYRAAEPGKLFYLSQRNIERLLEIARETDTEVLDTVWMNDDYPRFREVPAIAFLERNAFRSDRGASYPERPDSITVRQNRNPEEEVRFVAGEIFRLIREENCRYRDIAVIVSDVEIYGNYFRLVLEECGIPYFMDCKRDVLRNSFVEYVRSAVALVEERFSYESVFRFLKSGMSDMEPDDVFLLENYVLALGVHGYKQWSDKWIRPAKNMTEEDLERVETLRQKLMEELEDYLKAARSRDRTVESVTKALYGLFIKENSQLKCKEKEAYFKEKNQLALAREYSQIYRVVIDLFDQFVALLGREKVTITQYREILDAGLEQAKIGIVPPSMDQVMIGDMERTRLRDVRYVFCVGFNDMWLPGPGKSSGVLTDRERGFFEKREIKLAPSLWEQMNTKRFYLYLNLTKPSKRLYLSFSNVDMDGKTLRPSFYFFELRRLFPKLTVIDETPNAARNQILISKQGAARYLAASLADPGEALSDTTWLETYAWSARQSEDNRNLKGLLDARFSRDPKDALSEELAGKLYGELLYGSSTSLERYSRCPYSYFLQYGLYLREREEYSFRPVDEGSVMHRALYLFSEKVDARGYEWKSLDDETRHSLCEESLRQAAADHGNSVLYSTARRSYALVRMLSTLERTTWAIECQLGQGSFKPDGYELAFGSDGIQALTIPLRNSAPMRIRGQVDRLDLCRTENSVYVKVADYKTGLKEFDLASVYYGLDLQLFVYLTMAERYAAAKYKGKEIIPAGVLYHHVANPILKREDAADAADESLLMALRPSGVVNSSGASLALFDHALFDPAGGPKAGTTFTAPFAFKKDGSLKPSSDVLSAEEFELTRKHMERTLSSLGERILEGRIEVAPYSYKKTDACRYCLYKNVCGFDKNMDGYGKRELSSLSKEEVLLKMKAEVSADAKLDPKSAGRHTIEK